MGQGNSAAERGSATPRSTLNIVSQGWLGPVKQASAWGDTRPYQYKDYGGKECSRCTAPRDTTGRYCRCCRKLYNRVLRAKKKAEIAG